MPINKLQILLFTLLSISCYAQPKGYSSIDNLSSFKQQLNDANASVKNISSKFVQTKHLSLLAEEIKSNGSFYYAQPQKVRIEYLSPYKYIMVINDGKMLVKDEEKTSKINTKGSKLLQSINDVMIGCMSGRVLDNADFNVKAYQNSNRYLLELQPVNKDMKKMFSGIEVYMRKSNFDVVRLKMIEAGGDYTDMIFSDTKHNTKLNEDTFKVK